MKEPKYEIGERVKIHCITPGTEAFIDPSGVMHSYVGGDFVIRSRRMSSPKWGPQPMYVLDGMSFVWLEEYLCPVSSIFDVMEDELLEVLFV